MDNCFLWLSKVERKIKEVLSNKLKSVVGIQSDEEIYYTDNDTTIKLAKKFLIKITLDNDYNFIVWNFATEKYYEKYYFYTKNRTLFNPGNIVDFDISR